jgi:GDP/UDP-N,N'-diacetylbacillosamine 2-epimerase (hydrolysing)
MKKKICVLTTSRADYGLLKPLVIGLKKEKKFKTIFTVTGTHFVKNYGYSVKEILKDKIKIDKKIIIDLINKTSSDNISFLAGEYMKYFSKFLSENKPDYIILLGDRYEVLSAALTSYIMSIPIIHIAGGEVTTGSYDDGFRHSITKLSNIHFVTTKQHRKRVIQLGENPKTVFNVGSLGLINLKNIKYLKKKDIEKKLKTKLFKRNIILTFHPETRNNINIEALKLLFKVMNLINDLKVIITSPNLDKGRDEIMREILINKNKFPEKNIYVPNLGSQLYYSLAKISDGVVGNSSSGISEIPSLNVGTLNIGLRQSGRPIADSVIDLKKVSYKSLKINLHRLLSKKFKDKIITSTNPFYQKNTDKNIISLIKKIIMSKRINYKKFYDL